MYVTKLSRASSLKKYIDVYENLSMPICSFTALNPLTRISISKHNVPRVYNFLTPAAVLS